MKTKGLSRRRDPENERPTGTPRQISEVKLDVVPDYLYIYGYLLMVL